MLGERIKERRTAGRLSQEKVAELVGVSRQAVAKWESNQTAPSTENLFKLAEIFGTTADMLITEESSEKSTAEEIYSLYKKEQAEKSASRRRNLKKNLLTAGLVTAGYLIIYIIGRLVWCSSGTSFIGMLFTAKPEGAGSYLYGWLLSSNLFWLAMAVSAVPALFGKRRFSFTTLIFFTVGIILGMIFGPNPEGAFYGNSHYGWAIWVGSFLLSIPAGIVAQKFSAKNS